MTAPLFVSGTGTGVGKTWVTRGLARALLRRGHAVAALKPVETDCAPAPLDAVALARACGRPELAYAPGFPRAASPVAPYAALRRGEIAFDYPDLLRALAAAREPTDRVLVEGAGGLLVPLTRDRDMLHLATDLAADLLLVTADALGVLSATFTALDAADARGVAPIAVVLTRRAESDPSAADNLGILRERTAVPVLPFPSTPDDDARLADAAEASGLLDLVLRR